jgi:hypothetical protein
MLEVAEVQVVLSIEGHPLAETIRGSDLLDGTPVGHYAVDLAELAPALDAPITVDGEPLRVI